MASQKHTLSRRSFLAASAATAAAAGLPTTSRARAPLSWAQVLELVPELRAAYLAEVGRLARELEPRFASGEISAAFEGYDGTVASPRGRLEEACAARFGLQVERRELEDGGEELTGDEPAALLVLAVSPSAAEVLEDGGEGWLHVGYAANEAVTLDVAAARNGAPGPAPAGWPTEAEGQAARLALPAQARWAAEGAAAAAERFAGVVRAGGAPGTVARTARELYEAAGLAAGLCASLADLA